MALAGFNPWKPNEESLWILDKVEQVFEEYKDHLPLTGRQVFYRLVGAYGYDKSERAANKLYNVLGRARRCGWLSFDKLRDGGGQNATPQTYADDVAFWRKVDKDLFHFSRDRQAGQDLYVELFCEAPGMMPQLQRVAFQYSIAVYGTRGFTGLSVIHQTSLRALKRDVPTVILQVGDLDPSGVGIFDTLAADVKAFTAQVVSNCKPDRGAHHATLARRFGLSEDRITEISEARAGNGGSMRLPNVQAHRIALTWDQVEEHDLPTAPPSSKDSRSVNWPYPDTAQAEALPPDLLASIVRDSIENVLDMDRYDEEVAAEQADVESIRGNFPDYETD